MSFFQDKEYEEMDWLNLAQEMPVFTANDILIAMPDEIAITADVIANHGTPWNQIDLDSILKSHVPEGTHPNIKNALYKAYTFKVEDGTTYNFKTRNLRGEINLVKNFQMYEGEKLMKLMVNLTQTILRDRLGNIPYKSLDVSGRVNEIVDFLNNDSGIRKTRSLNRKIRILHHQYTTVIKEDKWRLRDMDLLLKAVNWACDYIKTGNLASLTNFNKLKVMTYKKDPIYSMEETV